MYGTEFSRNISKVGLKMVCNCSYLHCPNYSAWHRQPPVSSHKNLQHHQISPLSQDHSQYIAKYSRQQIQKNRLPQRSVLAQIHFNTHTNDQPLRNKTKPFMYVDDLTMSAQYMNFQMADNNLEVTIWNLSDYHRRSSLKAYSATTSTTPTLVDSLLIPN